LNLINKKKKYKNTITFILQFTLDDFKNKYAGSVLGIIWAFIQPLLTVLIYYFVFEMGFRSQPVENYPFILWLISGLIPWFFVSDSISGATPSLSEYAYLVKKVLFNINILPLVKLCSVLIVQLFLICIAIVLFCCFGYYPDIFYIQIIYYLIYMFVLTAGIIYISSSLYVFFKDMIQIISVILQIWFWITPIVWDINIMPDTIQTVLRYNPLSYIIRGYRNTFVYKVWFWQDWKENILFWGIAIFLCVVGILCFRKLKPHFADVL